MAAEELEPLFGGSILATARECAVSRRGRLASDSARVGFVITVVTAGSGDVIDGIEIVQRAPARST